MCSFLFRVDFGAGHEGGGENRLGMTKKGEAPSVQ